MANKLSHSSARMLSECGRKYKFHYVDRLREYNSSAALVFGSAIDSAINHLLEHRDVTAAIAAFNKAWLNARVAGDRAESFLPTNERIVYAKSDFDRDLLQEADYEFISNEMGIQNEPKLLFSMFQDAQDMKMSMGFNKMASGARRIHNLFYWVCLRHKGALMVDAYFKKVLPRIKEVHAVQKAIELEDDKGNKITGFIDAIVTWEDGKKYVVDTKTSSIEYSRDAAKVSQQLILYYHAEKEEYGLDGVGFVVLRKGIIKNKTKVCSKCNHDGSSASHKTCPNVVDGSRCHGEWTLGMDPQVDVNFIFDKVYPQVEQLVMDNFSLLNQKVDAKIFEANLGACTQSYGRCQFYQLCYFGSKEGLVEIPKEE